VSSRRNKRQPVISPSGPVTDLDGAVITDPSSNKPGFPTNFDPSATASLGYALTMLQAGVLVIYTYIADAHDPQRLDIPGAPAAPHGGNAYGPGEAGYVAALKAYDQAFGTFFSRLKGLGIDETNTLLSSCRTRTTTLSVARRARRIATA